MKKNLIKAVSAVCLGVTIVTGCSEKVDQVSDPSMEKVSIDVNIPTDETKLTGSVNDTKITNFQVFVYDASGRLETYVSSSTSDISIECTLGDKTVAVLANAPQISSGTTYSALLACRSSLKDNSDGSFVMAGETAVTVTPTTTSVSITVSRIVSKVRLAKFETAFEMPQYQSLPFKVSAVYLINVPADRGYLSGGTATEWYNKFKYVASDDCDLIYDDMNEVVVSTSSPYSTTNTFYCYPNPQSQDSFSTTWSARRTRLVVEAFLGDEKYYYPVTLPVLESNKIYDVKLTVKRPGSSTPDSEVEKYIAGLSIAVRDWGNGSTILEEI